MYRRDTMEDNWFSLRIPYRKMEVSHQSLCKFREKLQSMIIHLNVHCDVSISNDRLFMEFCCYPNGKKKIFLYSASPLLTEGCASEISLLLEFVVRGEVSDYEKLRRVVKKFAFFPKCKCSFRRTYVPGKVYNIQDTFSYLNNFFLQGKVNSPIFWRNPTIRGRRICGRKYKMSKIKSLKLGSYCPKCNYIFVNSILDNSSIPYWVVEAVVYHEMVHSYVFNFISCSASPHGKEFKSLYNRFPNAKEAKKELSSPHFFKNLKKIYLEKIG
ncbi:MAG: SprT-like domain-containing protein [Candidatus Hydrogenedentes bacterium]|nr:SprT-like domain-containing protein [Candidatus Hydrogenedentota bacterium]